MSDARAFVAPLPLPLPLPLASPINIPRPPRRGHIVPATAACADPDPAPAIPVKTLAETFAVPREARLGPLTLSPPVQLAPMAAVTTPVFRRLCAAHGAPLCTAEMLHADLFVADLDAAASASASASMTSDHSSDTTNEHGDDATSRRKRPRGTSMCFSETALFAPSAEETTPRSIQLLGSRPDTLARAAAHLVTAHGARHIDLNMGCPAPKVLRRGGGAALPGNDALLREIAVAVRAVVPPDVALSAKLRLGARGDLSYLRAARTLASAGFDAVTLHARTAEQRYARGAARAQWRCVAELVREVGRDLTVFGNGDVFTAADAAALLARTGAAGVVVGRGALGRPWLFDDLSAMLLCDPRKNTDALDSAVEAASAHVTIPPFHVVRDTMMRHLVAEIAWQTTTRAGLCDETAAVRGVRKWVAWYTQGYDVPATWTRSLLAADSVAQLAAAADALDASRVRVADAALAVAERGKTQ